MTPLLNLRRIAPAVLRALAVAIHLAALVVPLPPRHPPTGAVAPSILRWRWCSLRRHLRQPSLLRPGPSPCYCSLGQLDLMSALSYGLLVRLFDRRRLMFWFGRLLRYACASARRCGIDARSGSHGWIHGLPLKMRFTRSEDLFVVMGFPIVVVGLIIGFNRRGDGHRAVALLISYPDHFYRFGGRPSPVIRHSMVLTLVTMVFATMLARVHQPSGRCRAGADS